MSGIWIPKMKRAELIFRTWGCGGYRNQLPMQRSHRHVGICWRQTHRGVRPRLWWLRIMSIENNVNETGRPLILYHHHLVKFPRSARPFFAAAGCFLSKGWAIAAPCTTHRRLATFNQQDSSLASTLPPKRGSEMAETGGFCFLASDYLSVAVVTLGPLILLPNWTLFLQLHALLCLLCHVLHPHPDSSHSFNSGYWAHGSCLGGHSQSVQHIHCRHIRSSCQKLEEHLYPPMRHGLGHWKTSHMMLPRDISLHWGSVCPSSHYTKNLGKGREEGEYGECGECGKGEGVLALENFVIFILSYLTFAWAWG